MQKIKVYMNRIAISLFLFSNSILCFSQNNVSFEGQYTNISKNFNDSITQFLLINNYGEFEYYLNYDSSYTDMKCRYTYGKYVRRRKSIFLYSNFICESNISILGDGQKNDTISIKVINPISNIPVDNYELIVKTIKEDDYNYKEEIKVYFSNKHGWIYLPCQESEIINFCSNIEGNIEYYPLKNENDYLINYLGCKPIVFNNVKAKFSDNNLTMTIKTVSGYFLGFRKYRKIIYIFKKVEGN